MQLVDFPMDILISIPSFLATTTDFLSLSCTNRQFHNICLTTTNKKLLSLLTEHTLNTKLPENSGEDSIAGPQISKFWDWYFENAEHRTAFKNTGFKLRAYLVYRYMRERELKVDFCELAIWCLLAKFCFYPWWKSSDGIASAQAPLRRAIRKEYAWRNGKTIG
ncbi:hypothetical protein BDD12DRAFT_885827 [Trichophaea hybrida]|nr:hypothetical protein BDD12DRAFT_885827 [Trichophaea hybrida]